jgi:hypothetical protein
MDHGYFQTMKKNIGEYSLSLADFIGEGGEVSMYVKKLNPMLLIG